MKEMYEVFQNKSNIYPETLCRRQRPGYSGVIRIQDWRQRNTPLKYITVKLTENRKRHQACSKPGETVGNLHLQNKMLKYQKHIANPGPQENDYTIAQPNILWDVY
ncbi:uncharacterized protein LOC124556730 [Schistocerca americana]|uniref:uncharacterized protein LOC124556730 n=1 Tax=Schistocerca americana TaxID=7009 RepID=UPI001F500959|nr:uncharacterized protein LOC124556730 [Schistocerca americana]